MLTHLHSDGHTYTHVHTYTHTHTHTHTHIHAQTHTHTHTHTHIHTHTHVPTITHARCDCPRTRSGTNCEILLTGIALQQRCSAMQFPSHQKCNLGFGSNGCINHCNDRGTCDTGFCVCSPGACVCMPARKCGLKFIVMRIETIYT